MKLHAFKTGFYSLVLLLLFSQCQQKSERAVNLSMTDFSATEAVTEEVSEVVASEGNNSAANPVPASGSDTSVQRMLTKEGTLRWETSNLYKTHHAILEHAKKYDAYISNDDQARDEYQITATLEMRIPADRFDAFIASVEDEVTKFDVKNIRILDVTEEFIDVSARLRTKKELEQHYFELLKQTKNVTEVLQVEAELNTVRGDIESAEGRLKYLKDKVSMSTLQLTFYETTSAPVGFFGEIGKSLVEGWKNFLYFLLGVLRIWPILLFAAVLLFLIIRRVRRKK